MSAVPVKRATARLLRRLAQRGRVLVQVLVQVPPGGGGRTEGAWGIVDRAACGNGVDPTGDGFETVDDEAAKCAKRRGLIEPAAGLPMTLGTGWQLSRRGRALLRGGEMIQEAMGYATGQDRRASAADPLHDSPVGWLRRHKGRDGAPLVGQAECLASERLKADYFSATHLPNTTLNWSLAGSVDHGKSTPDAGVGERMDRLIMARRRLQAALDHVGPEMAPVLIAACCHARGLKQIEDAQGWPQRSAKVVLAIALQQLARHYGLASPERRAGPER